MYIPELAPWVLVLRTRDSDAQAEVLAEGLGELCWEGFLFSNQVFYSICHQEADRIISNKKPTVYLAHIIFFLGIERGWVTCPKSPRQELGFEPTSAGLHYTSPLLLTIAEILKQYILPFRAPREAHASPTLPSWAKSFYPWGCLLQYLGPAILPRA